MIDFHSHTFWSDGVLVPAELTRRANHVGYRALGITDHVDGSNISVVVRALAKVAAELNRFQDTFVIPGAEITHVPPAQIRELVSQARELGAAVVVVHGESPVEPVAVGTNRAGIESGADILAHPGFITLEDATLAAERGVFLEITARSGHSLTNGHVARMAEESGASLVIGTDTHSPENLITRERAFQILIGSGLTETRALAALANNEALFERIKNAMG